LSEEESVIRSNMFTRQVEGAQKRVEGNNYDTRKQVLQYDDVMREQREIIYAQRYDVITADRDLAPEIHAMIRRWARAEKANGPQVLKHGKQHPWTPEEKLKLITKVLAGRTAQSVALEAGIGSRLLYDWVQKYKIYGYNGLVSKKKGRKPKDPVKMKKVNINNPRKLQESEYEELLRLREENALIKAENEVIKKEIALREEKEAARLKARKQRSSKNSATEDTN